VYINVELPEEIINRLKKKTKEETTKDALYKAVMHYLECFSTEITKEIEIMKVKRTRKNNKERGPIYLRNVAEKI